MKCSTNVHWFHSTTGSYKDEYCQSSPVSKALDTGLHRQNTLLPEAHAERLISTRFYSLLLIIIYIVCMFVKLQNQKISTTKLSHQISIDGSRVTPAPTVCCSWQVCVVAHCWICYQCQLRSQNTDPCN